MPFRHPCRYAAAPLKEKMIDAFVLLTPILVLGIIALLGFVGCNQVLGLDPTTEVPTVESIVPSSGTPRVEPAWWSLVRGSTMAVR